MCTRNEWVSMFILTPDPWAQVQRAACLFIEMMDEHCYVGMMNEIKSVNKGLGVLKKYKKLGFLKLGSTHRDHTTEQTCTAQSNTSQEQTTKIKRKICTRNLLYCTQKILHLMARHPTQP